MLADQPPRPANMRTIVAINQGGVPESDDPSPPSVLPPSDVEQSIHGGAIVLDVRAHTEFEREHVAGSIHVAATSASFEQYAGWIVPEEGPLIVMADDEASGLEAVHKLAFVGLDLRVIGRCTLHSWVADGRDVVSTPPLDVRHVHAELDRARIRLLDVRERDEFVSGHVPGATHLNFKYLPNELDDLDWSSRDRVAVMCAGGLRSAIACSVLRRAGFRDVRNVDGGMEAWNRAGLPVDHPAR